MQIESAKRYVVEVFSDKGPLEASPWLLIGEFKDAKQALEACKSVLDAFLYRSRIQGLDDESLMHQFLNYGDVPCINRAENMKIFDPYRYISEKSPYLTLDTPNSNSKTTF